MFISTKFKFFISIMILCKSIKVQIYICVTDCLISIVLFYVGTSPSTKRIFSKVWKRWGIIIMSIPNWQWRKFSTGWRWSKNSFPLIFAWINAYLLSFVFKGCNQIVQEIAISGVIRAAPSTVSTRISFNIQPNSTI